MRAGYNPLDDEVSEPAYGEDTISLGYWRFSLEIDGSNPFPSILYLVLHFPAIAIHEYGHHLGFRLAEVKYRITGNADVGVVAKTAPYLNLVFCLSGLVIMFASLYYGSIYLGFLGVYAMYSNLVGVFAPSDLNWEEKYDDEFLKEVEQKIRKDS